MNTQGEAVEDMANHPNEVKDPMAVAGQALKTEAAITHHQGPIQLTFDCIIKYLNIRLREFLASLF